MKRNYPLWQRIFGPRITQDEIFDLEIKATAEGWYDFLIWSLVVQPNGKRQLNWLLAGLRDGYITVTVVEYAESEAYTDDNPFQNED